MRYRLNMCILLCLLATLGFSQTVGTFCGSGLVGSIDSIAAFASFNLPTGVCIDQAGNLFIADRYNHKIRKVNPNGKVTTIAGTGFVGNIDGPGASASFNQPTGICIDPAGNLFVADTYNNKIRKITPAGVVSTFAGTGASGSTDGPGNIATFNLLGGICINSTGEFYVTDWANHKIRKITASGVVSTLAGSGTAGNIDATGSAASFNLPTGVCSDANNNIYVVDYNNQKIRKVSSSGVVTTLAGTGLVGSTDGPSASASFNYPYGICYDASGAFYVIDTYNNKIRKISTTGLVHTIAGTGFTGSLDGDALLATFNYPTGICTNNQGTLYIVDYANNKIRYMTLSVGIEEHLKSSLSLTVSPNPSKNIFTINLDDRENLIIVYDQNGSEVYRKIASGVNYNIDLGSQKSGLYVIVTTDSDGKVHIGKVILEK